MRLKTYLTIPVILCLLALGQLDSSALASEAASAASAAAEGLSTRIYDLSFLPTEIEEHYEPLSLIPFQPFHRGMEVEEAEGAGPLALERDLIVDAIHSVIGLENLEQSGIFIELIPQGLVVRGPEAVHGIVLELLAFLRARLERAVELDIEIFTATGEGGLEISDAASVRRAFTEGRLWPVLKRSATVRVGELLDVSNGTETSVVWDNDTEIAQQSFVMEPITADLFTGIRFSVRPLIAANGKNVLLSLFATGSDLQEPLVTRDLKFYGRLAMDNAVQEIPVGLAIDDIKVNFASVAGLMSVESGATAVVGTAFPHHTGTAGLVILLTPRLRPVPGRIDLDNGWTLTAMDFSHLLSDVLMPLEFLKINRLDWPIEDEIMASLAPPGRLAFTELEDYLDCLLWGESSPLHEWQEEDNLHLDIVGNTILIRSREVPVEEVCRYVESIPFTADGPIHATISCVAADGPAIIEDVSEILSRGITLGATALPLKAGGTAAAYAGMEGIMVADYEVDVANNSAVPNPLMEGFIDGAHIHVAHERDALSMGNGTIRARVNLSVLKPPFRSRRLSEKGGLSGIIDQPAFDRAVIDTRFACDGSAHLLGTLTGERDGRVMTIYVIGQAQ